MSKYVFSDKHFGISEEGIHLMRNGFNYNKTIPFREVDSVRFEKGNSLKNRPFLLLLGLGSVGFAVYSIIRFIIFFNSPGSGIVYVEHLLLPILPLLIGGYMLYAVSRIEPILKMMYGNSVVKFSLREFIKSEKIDETKSFLRANTSFADNLH